MKIISYFLPQFYPTPENDQYWGKGFTDWDSAKSAKKYFSTHRVPLVPEKFGYYDLSLIKNIKLINDYSIEKGLDGFGYWHYWFGNGFQTLEKVPELHLENKSINQNYFFAWANTSWTKSWIGDDNTIIFNQQYSKRSAIDHFKYLRQFFEDDRYIKYNSKPIFQVINPNSNGTKEHILILEELSIKTFGHGLHWLFANNKIKGINEDYKDINYSIVGYPPGNSLDFLFKIKKIMVDNGLKTGPILFSEKKYLSIFKRNLMNNLSSYDSFFPCLLAGWDNTPRYKEKGYLIDVKISSFLNKQLKVVNNIYSEQKLPSFIFVKALNEWAEGNILEPHKFNGDIDYPLNVIKEFKESVY